MNRLVVTSVFHTAYKRLLKKYRSLSSQLVDLESKLLENPQLGTDLGNGIYKIRLPNPDKPSGKSGGYRVITYLVNKVKDVTTINLIVIYDKSQVSDISKDELLKIIRRIFDD